MQLNKLELDEIRKSISSVEVVLSSLKEKIEKIDDCEEKDLELIPGLDMEMTLKINDIMDNFEFDKVHSVMKFLGWRWGFVEDKFGIPNVQELRKFAKGLLIEASKKRTCISSGGFRVQYEDSDEKFNERFIQLEFILTDYEGFAE